MTADVVGVLAGDRQRLNRATPGPWSAADEHGLWPGATPAWCVNQMEGEKYLRDVAYIPQTGSNEQADAEFIAWARAGVGRYLDLAQAVLDLADEREGEYGDLADLLIEQIRRAVTTALGATE